MKEKYEGYYEWWRGGGTQRHLRATYFRVLTICDDEHHMHSLRKKAAHGIGADAVRGITTWKFFMFSHLGAFSLERPESILEPIFFLADEGDPWSLVRGLVPA